jgi:DNA primase
MIPIRDERGRVVGFGARALAAEDNPKYLNSPQSPVFDKSRLLFGLDFAARTIRDTETVVIVEGYLDTIQAHQAGYTNVVAQMGTALTETQLKLVAPRLAKKIVLALDSDAAGQNATRRSLEVARETLQVDYAGDGSRYSHSGTADAKDPDDLIREVPNSGNACRSGDAGGGPVIAWRWKRCRRMQACKSVKQARFTATLNCFGRRHARKIICKAGDETADRQRDRWRGQANSRKLRLKCNVTRHRRLITTRSRRMTPIMICRTLTHRSVHGREQQGHQLISRSWSGIVYASCSRSRNCFIM